MSAPDLTAARKIVDEHRREDERRDISTAQSCRDDARFEAEAEAREFNQQREEAA